MKNYKHYDFLPIAKVDLKDAILYYKLTGVKGLSKRFSQAVKAAIGQVLKNPGAYAIRYKNIRIIHTDTFPYAIHFFVENDSIIITAIIYNRRDPDVTLKRV
jgi:hypothetical protein